VGEAWVLIALLSNGSDDGKEKYSTVEEHDAK
jgi:hypothetical protein